MLNRANCRRREPDESRRVEHTKQTSPTVARRRPDVGWWRLSAWCVPAFRVGFTVGGPLFLIMNFQTAAISTTTNAIHFDRFCQIKLNPLLVPLTGHFTLKVLAHWVRNFCTSFLVFFRIRHPFLSKCLLLVVQRITKLTVRIILRILSHGSDHFSDQQKKVV